ncbi:MULTISPECIES: hypothetical protein [unclassified Enterococcus]|uniref:hypothetical protein n=1 Tax=unclassified Enterococcus TaxID=2608891 RepID=UPI001551E562|nr:MULTISPECIES: hypothetical protein [unclassified Enterococcus]MBS7578202.1 hypothetical protein [Enterococcus sp. MMGLQ5-2]MBS7585422.1 hypothetical protein [Enterococcus sp. MMGLQ5-1]NPD13279.1 hypothetical protein [Enterococcus sp. MMGLQ5-1]NPD38033.1 hypothetical protein [Enterococcus sp. MMGLQ5-2]
MKNIGLIILSIIITSLNVAAFGLVVGLMATAGVIAALASGYIYFQMKKEKIIEESHLSNQPFFNNEEEWKAYYHRDATPLSEESELKILLAENINQLAVS